MRRLSTPAMAAAVSMAATLAAVLLLTPGTVQGKAYCGEITSSFGPFDYRDADLADNLAMVDSAHYTEDVAMGVKGNTGSIGGDLNYTLHAFPNHARALQTLGSVTLRLKVVQLPGAKYPTECYFERAMRFAPDDGAVLAVYANYLHAKGDYEQELPLLLRATALQPDNATIEYNLGLAYARRKDYGHALEHAQKAYAQGFPLPGLRQMLVDAGQWRAAPQ